MMGEEIDIATLRQTLVAEANIQRTLADHAAQTTLEASQVMVIVDARSVAAPAISTGAGEPYRTGTNKLVLPEVKEQSVLEWLQVLDLSGKK